MLYEGIKETQNTRIEKDDETAEEIEMLYSFGVVLFEHTLLESDEYTYSICYFPPKEVYDIVIENKNDKSLKEYKVTDKLDKRYDELFGLIKNQELTDEKNIKYKCMSHSIEYTL